MQHDDDANALGFKQASLKQQLGMIEKELQELSKYKDQDVDRMIDR